jgi:hypothetical protein
MKETKYPCPVCKGMLVAQIGNVIHPGDPKFGVGLHCPHVTCPAQEVQGHGDNEKHAFEIVTDRFKNLV